jgi:hypothetical protein
MKNGNDSVNFMQTVDPDFTCHPPYTTTWAMIPDPGYCQELVGKNVTLFTYFAENESSDDNIELTGKVEKVTANYILLDTAFIVFENVRFIKINKQD